MIDCREYREAAGADRDHDELKDRREADIQARNRASVCNHSPMIRARCSRSVGQVFGKT